MPLLFLLFPALEIYLYVVLGGAIGAGPTLGVIVGAIALGLAILRFQGFSMLLRAQRALAEGKQPVAPILEGVAVLIAGLLLLLPGMISDVLGLVLLIPPLRRALIGVIAKAISRRLRQGETASRRQRRDDAPMADTGEVIEGSFSELPPEPNERLEANREEPRERP